MARPADAARARSPNPRSAATLARRRLRLPHPGHGWPGGPGRRGCRPSQRSRRRASRTSPTSADPGRGTHRRATPRHERGDRRAIRPTVPRAPMAHPTPPPRPAHRSPLRRRVRPRGTSLESRPDDTFQSVLVGLGTAVRNDRRLDQRPPPDVVLTVLAWTTRANRRPDTIHQLVGAQGGENGRLAAVTSPGSRSPTKLLNNGRSCMPHARHRTTSPTNAAKTPNDHCGRGSSPRRRGYRSGLLAGPRGLLQLVPECPWEPSDLRLS